jgi:hypothetical protein
MGIPDVAGKRGPARAMERGPVHRGWSRRPARAQVASAGDQPHIFINVPPQARLWAPCSGRSVAYLRLSLSNTLGWLVGVPGVAEVLVVPAVVARDRPRMKYQTIPAMITRAIMIHNHGTPPPSVVAGAAGEPDAAGGVAWAKASFTAASVMIVNTWSLLSIMVPFRPQGLRINVGHGPAFLSLRGLAHRCPNSSTNEAKSEDGIRSYDAGTGIGSSDWSLALPPRSYRRRQP